VLKKTVNVKFRGRNQGESRLFIYNWRKCETRISQTFGEIDAYIVVFTMYLTLK